MAIQAGTEKAEIRRSRTGLKPSGPPAPRCGPHTYRCPSSRDYGSITRACCRRHIIDLTITIGEALNEEGILWWADYGTLLGAARHGDIVPWDKDADLGVLYEDWDACRKVMKAVCAKNRFHLRIRSRRHSMKIALSEINRTNVDIFFWQEKEDGTLFRAAYASSDRYKGREFPKEWLGDMTTLPFAGFEVNAPHYWKRLLNHRYGSKWHKPIRANNDGVPR